MSVVEVIRQEAFEDLELRVIEENGEEWFSAEDIGKALGMSDPRPSVIRILNRNRDEFEGLYRVVSLTTWLKTGGRRPYRFTTFNPQGAYLLAILARTPKSKSLRRWLAKFMAQNRLRDHVTTLEAQIRQKDEQLLTLRGKLGASVRERKKLEAPVPALAAPATPRYQFKPGDVVRLNFRDLRKLAFMAMHKDEKFALGLLHQVLDEQTPDEGPDFSSLIAKRDSILHLVESLATLLESLKSLISSL